MINVKMQSEDTIELDMIGEVTGDDYKKVKPQLEAIFKKVGKAKFLIDLNQLKKFDLSAIYQDIKFDLQHLKNIGTTAIVGTKKTYEALSSVIDKFYPEKIKHFEDQVEALHWLRAN